MDGDKPTDGCITTQGKFEHSFGYYVARIQLQSQPGHWSAFWITGPGVGKVGDDARDGCEIDIMEKPWLDERVQHTFHWDGYGKGHKSEGHVAKVPGVMEGWHSFGLWWKPDEYIFFVDGKETWRSKGTSPTSRLRRSSSCFATRLPTPQSHQCRSNRSVARPGVASRWSRCGRRG